MGSPQICLINVSGCGIDNKLPYGVFAHARPHDLAIIVAISFAAGYGRAQQSRIDVTQDT